MKKTFFSKMLLVVIILALVFTGCNGSKKESTSTGTGKTTSASDASPSNLKPIELVWYTAVDYIRADMDMVWDQIDKYLKEKINVTLDRHFYPMADYKEKIPTVVSSGQYMDIVFTGIL